MINNPSNLSIIEESMAERVLITGIGEHPISATHAIRSEEPTDVHIVCSEWQRTNVAEDSGYDKNNEQVILDAIMEVGGMGNFHDCDVFDPEDVWDTIISILEENMDDDGNPIVINYASGSAITRIMLGAIGAVASSFADIKLLYAIDYEEEGVEMTLDHTEKFQNLFEELYEIYLMKEEEEK